MFSEFRAFIARGNVLDLAVAVIIGAAFATIVASLTGDLIMPLVGAIFGGMDFANHFTLLGPIPDGFKGDPSSYVDLKAGDCSPRSIMRLAARTIRKMTKARIRKLIATVTNWPQPSTATPPALRST